MRKSKVKSLLLLIVVVFFSAGVTAQSSDAANHGSQNRLVGAWKLVSLEEPVADGQAGKVDCAGMFVFTPDGKASVQVMYQKAQTGSAYAQSGYEASYGSYHVDDSKTFTFHIEGALVRSLIGKDLRRAYKITGSLLTVTSTDATEHWKVVWERYQ